MLRDEGIQFHVCKIPHVKYAVVDLAHRKLGSTNTLILKIPTHI